MDMRIYKYQLLITDVQQVPMPHGARILSVANQNDVLCLWALVDSQGRTELRTIEIIGTGTPVYQDMGVSREFIGTVLMRPFVWHVFERK